MIKDLINKFFTFIFLCFFILFSILFLNIHIFDTEEYLIESLLQLILIATAVSFTLCVKTRISINYIEFSILLFLTYVALNSYRFLELASYSFFWVLLYFTWKSIFLRSRQTVINGLLLSITSIFLFYIITLGINGTSKAAIESLFKPNVSIFSILLASQLVFIMPWYGKKANRKNPFAFLLIVLTLTGMLVLILTKGRSGWLGLLAATTFIIYMLSGSKTVRRILLAAGIVLLSTSTALLFYFKGNSSGGRLLIYKVSAKLLEHNWLTGIGSGKFKVKYNEQQAVYFASNNINDRKSLLADNTFYAFNDFYQLLIENGVIGFLLFTVTVGFLGLHIKSVQLENKNKHLFYAAAGSLICILFAALFSYPLQVFPITLQAVICLAIINSYPSAKPSYTSVAFSRRVTKVIFTVVSLLLMLHFFVVLRYKAKAHTAFELSRSGYKAKAIQIYDGLSKSYIKDGIVLYQYAKELYHVNKLPEAKRVLDEAKKYYCDNQVYLLSARIASEMKDYKKAEADFTTAVFMVPNRMLPRAELLNFYLERKDTINAIFWAQSVLNMPVKVPSNITDITIKQTRWVLGELLKQ